MIGIDVGGANLKIVDERGVHIHYCPLWKESNLAQIVSTYASADNAAVVMSGELTDGFFNKTEGISFIVDSVIQTFQTLRTPMGQKRITVNIRRFKCKKCGNLIYAQEPFYPDTRLGSAIVDMAISLSRLHSYSHTAEIMKALGIEIDRGSVRNYALSDLAIPQANFLYGMQLPNSFISLMTKEISGPKGSISSQEILASSGYPASYKAPTDGKGTSAEFQKHKKLKKKS